MKLQKIIDGGKFYKERTSGVGLISSTYVDISNLNSINEFKQFYFGQAFDF